jgi:lipopolysaccharide export system permease protein
MTLTRMRLKTGFRPTLVDRYLAAEIAAPFLGGMAFFTFVFLMFQLLRLAEFFIVHGVPFFSLLKLTALLCVSFLPFALPISFLIGVMLAFGRLSTDSELVALKAGGYSLRRLTAPALALAILISGVSLVLNSDWAPMAEKELRKQLTEIGNTKIVSAIQEGTFTSGFYDLLIFADKVNPKTNQMRGVFIYDERDPVNPMTVVARHGRWITRRTDNGGSEAVLRLQDGNIHRSEATEGSYQKIDFEQYRLFLKIEGGTRGVGEKPKMMTTSEISEAMDGVKNPNSRRYRMLQGEFWRRIAVGLAPLCFLLLGVGQGSIPTRSIRSGSAIIAFGVLLGYHQLLAWGSALVENGSLPAWIALQVGNLLTAAWGLWAFRSASRT